MSANFKFVLIAQILSICIPVGAATPIQVKQECERQMAAGICFAKISRASIPPGASIVLSGAGRVSYAAYLDFIDKYNDKNPNDMSMCKLALHYMLAEPGGDHDKIARAMWAPAPPSTINK